MHRKNFYYATLIVGVTAALTLAITLKLSRSRSATPVPPAADASLLARAATPADDSKGAQKEGIKVHGHWTIDVRNPDGTLVTHREFENALLFSGQLTLAKLLGRQATTGLWFIMLEPCPVPCIAPWNSKGSGTIAEPNSLFTASPFVSKNLTVSVTPLGGVNARSLILSGTITAEKNGVIGDVETRMRSCSQSVASDSCNDQDSSSVEHIMTHATLPTPQDVVAGQIVQVTVIISFS